MAKIHSEIMSAPLCLRPCIVPVHAGICAVGYSHTCVPAKWVSPPTQGVRAVIVYIAHVHVTADAHCTSRP